MVGHQQQFHPGRVNAIVQRYETPGNPEAFSGINNVAIQNRVSNETAALALSESESYGLHRQYRRPARKNPYFTMYRRQQCQLDLVDISQLRADNRGYSYLLILIDCFSRKVWLRPVTHKSGEAVVQAMTSIFREMGELPEQIVCDRGREFVNGSFQDFLASRNVRLVHPNSEMKASIVERANKSLQSLIYKYMDVLPETRTYYGALRAVLHTYNNRPHRSIAKLTPNQAELEVHKNTVASALRQHYSKAIPEKSIVKYQHGKSLEEARAEPKFKIGDTTRIKTGYGLAFPRGYEEQFSRELFRVKGIRRRMPIPMYELWSLNDQDVIEGSTYKEELQRAPADVLRFHVRRRRWKRRQGQWVPEMLVRWKGFDRQHDQWVREDIPLVRSFRVAPPLDRTRREEEEQQQQALPGAAAPVAVAPPRPPPPGAGH